MRGAFIFISRMLVVFLPFYMLSKTFSQNSLWKDHNPYRKAYVPGELIEIDVREKFAVDAEGIWENGQRLEFKLYPDTKNLPFLTNSEQSKNRKKNSKTKYKLRDNYNFKVMGILEAGTAPNMNIRAQKTVSVDGKPARMVLTGIIDPGKVKQGKITSSQIANLSLTITGELPVPRAQNINLKPPANPNQPQPAVNRAELSEQEKQTYLLQHLREILGGLNQ